MGFFATFWQWLDGQLANYIGDNLAKVSAALEPAVLTLMTLYVMVWGYLQLTGRIEEPFMTGLRRILIVAIVLGVSLRLWLYNTVITNTFYQAPVALAAAITGVTDPVAMVDSLWENGGAVADQLFHAEAAGAGFTAYFAYYLVALVVWLMMGLLCVYTMFLIALAHVALSILLALGPLFIAMLPFDATRRLFDSWLAQLTNYALITILTAMSASLLLTIVSSYAAQTAGLGTGMKIVDTLNMVLASALVFLFMRQVMPVAASLAGSGSISTLGAISRTISWSRRAAWSAIKYGVERKRKAREAGRNPA